MSDIRQDVVARVVDSLVNQLRCWADAPMYKATVIGPQSMDWGAKWGVGLSVGDGLFRKRMASFGLVGLPPMSRDEANAVAAELRKRGAK